MDTSDGAESLDSSLPASSGNYTLTIGESPAPSSTDKDTSLSQRNSAGTYNVCFNL